MASGSWRLVGERERDAGDAEHVLHGGTEEDVEELGKKLAHKASEGDGSRAQTQAGRRTRGARKWACPFHWPAGG